MTIRTFLTVQLEEIRNNVSPTILRMPILLHYICTLVCRLAFEMLFFLIDSFVLKSLCPSLLTSPPKLLFEFVFFQNMHFSGHLAEIAINPLQVYAVSSQDSQAMKLSIIGLTHSPFDHDVYWNCQWIPRQCIICFQKSVQSYPHSIFCTFNCTNPWKLTKLDKNPQEIQSGFMIDFREENTVF